MKVIVATSALVLGLVSVGWGGIREDVGLLPVVADRYEANWERLKTWRGTAHITSSIVTGQGLWVWQ